MAILALLIIVAILCGYLRGIEPPLPNDRQFGFKDRWRSIIADVLTYTLLLSALQPIRHVFGVEDSLLLGLLLMLCVVGSCFFVQTLLGRLIRKRRNQPPPPILGINVFGG